MKITRELFEECKEEFTPAMREFLPLFLKYVPNGDLLKVNKSRHGDYIVLYYDKQNPTPYIVHHLNKSGLYWGHYETNKHDALEAFNKM